MEFWVVSCLKRQLLVSSVSITQTIVHLFVLVPACAIWMYLYLCICVFVYLCICVFVFVYLYCVVSSVSITQTIVHLFVPAVPPIFCHHCNFDAAELIRLH